MMGSTKLSRRRVLASAIASVAAGIAGCLDGTVGDGGTETARESDTPTESRRIDDFYIENLGSDERRVELSVSAGGDSIIDGTYQVPSTTGLVFEDVGHEGTSYEVVAEARGGSSVTATWDVASCEESEAPSGNRDGAVRFEDGDHRFVQNACDAIGVGVRSIPYEDADEYEQ